MKFIVDMNLSPDRAALLSSQGLESAHWRDIGEAAATDRTIFDHARQSRAIIITQDLDFGVILAQTKASSPRVALALRTCAHELATGAILTLDDNRHRVRLLPLRPESIQS